MYVRCDLFLAFFCECYFLFRDGIIAGGPNSAHFLYCSHPLPPILSHGNLGALSRQEEVCSLSQTAADAECIEGKWASSACPLYFLGVD